MSVKAYSHKKNMKNELWSLQKLCSYEFKDFKDDEALYGLCCTNYDS